MLIVSLFACILLHYCPGKSLCKQTYNNSVLGRQDFNLMQHFIINFYIYTCTCIHLINTTYLSTLYFIITTFYQHYIFINTVFYQHDMLSTIQHYIY